MYGASSKVEWGFYGTFNGNAEEGRNMKEKGTDNVYVKSGAYLEPS